MDIANQVIDIDLNNILPNRFQPRIRFSEDALNELTNSIKEHGVIQPITVRPVGNKYEIVAGERRYKASVLAGKQSIPAIIVNLDDNSCAELALIENVQRQDLTPIEEAISYKKILDMSSLTQEALANKLGKNQSTIANKLRLLNLDEEVQKALLENRISERHARSLLRINNNADQKEMLNRIITERLTVRRTDEEIMKLLEKNKEMVGENNMNGNFNNFNQGNNMYGFSMAPNNQENNNTSTQSMDAFNNIQPMENNNMNNNQNMNNQFNPNMFEQNNNVNQLIEQANNITPDFNIPTTPIQETTMSQIPSQNDNLVNPIGNNNEVTFFNNVQPEPVQFEQPSMQPESNFNNMGIPSFNNNVENNELRPVQFFNLNEQPVSNNMNETTNFASQEKNPTNDIFNFQPDPSQMTTQIPTIENKVQPEFIDNLEDKAVNMDFGTPVFNPQAINEQPNSTIQNNIMQPINNFQPQVEIPTNNIQSELKQQSEIKAEPQINIPSMPTMNSTIEMPSFMPEQPQELEPKRTEKVPSVNNIRQAIDEIRSLSNKLESMGFRIETEEFDLENAYQVIFKIGKN